MAEQKTKPTNTDVLEFLKNFVETEQKFQDSLALLKIMQEVRNGKSLYLCQETGRYKSGRAPAMMQSTISFLKTEYPD